MPLVNVILVLGSERLFSDMSRRFASIGDSGDEAVHVLKLTKTGGAVERDKTYMKQLHQAQIRAYFFGTPKNTLSPHTTSVDFNSLNILKFADGEATHGLAESLADRHTASSAGLDFMPGGAYDDDASTDQKPRGEAIFEPCAPSMALQSALLVVKHANPTDPYDTIRDASVMGYLYVSDVDESKQRIKILSPIGGRLPARAIVWNPWDVASGMGDLLA